MVCKVVVLKWGWSDGIMRCVVDNKVFGRNG